MYGYFEPDGEYVYYEDVEAEMSSRAFEEVGNSRYLYLAVIFFIYG